MKILVCGGMGFIGSNFIKSHISNNANDEIINVVGAPTINHPFPPNPPCAPHTAYLNAGAPNVYINNIKVGRFGDSADAGAMLEPPGVTVYAGNA